jgi:energy-coupling factor transporter ATP-binding protein EcfA2
MTIPWVVGRDKRECEEFGEVASIFLGKSLVGDQEPIYLDVDKAHVILICGKRGTGKSWTLGNIVEGIAESPPEVRKEIATIIVDTMGIFWSLKFPARRTEQLKLLEKWGMKPREFDVKVFVPRGLKEQYKFEVETFAFHPSDITPEDWCLTFEMDENQPMGIAITKAVSKLNERTSKWDISDIITEINSDPYNAESTMRALENKLRAAENWGIFSLEGFRAEDFLKPGQISVIDISELKHGTKQWSIRALVVGLLIKKILDIRLEKRKEEEFKEISGTLREESNIASKVWILIDEAHEFLPSAYSTAASYPLEVAIKEGRYPGITIVLATQNPGKMSSEAITQSDILLAHRVTARPDIDGLNQIHHTYLKSDIKDSLNELPRDLRGGALLFDDKRELISQILIRPRMSWHAGAESSIIKKIVMSGVSVMELLRKMRKEEWNLNRS